MKTVKFGEVWVGQTIHAPEPGHRKKYTVLSIMENPDRIVVRAVGGTNRRTISREEMELRWFPAGAVEGGRD
jgi:hypothetical protein